MTYAHARRLDALNGDWIFAANTFTPSPSPALEIVVLTLRTPLGSCAADATIGTDWARVAKVGPRAASDAKAVIEAALAPLVRRRVLSGLTVVTEARPDGRIFYTVDFVDVRLGGPARRAEGLSP